MLSSHQIFAYFFLEMVSKHPTIVNDFIEEYIDHHDGPTGLSNLARLRSDAGVILSDGDVE